MKHATFGSQTIQTEEKVWMSVCRMIPLVAGMQEGCLGSSVRLFVTFGTNAFNHIVDGMRSESVGNINQRHTD